MRELILLRSVYQGLFFVRLLCLNLKFFFSGYSICPVENRGSLLLELMSRYFDGREGAWNKKIVIIFAHDNSIKFYTELFKRLKELPIMPVLVRNF